MAASRFVVSGICALALGGCVAAGIEAASAGAGSVVDAGLGESRTGAVTRTFTAPFDRVRAATIGALERMAFDHRQESTSIDGEKLVARAGNHDIEIEIARLSPNATRLRVLADGPGLLRKDPATGHEIVQQTAKVLEAGELAAR